MNRKHCHICNIHQTLWMTTKKVWQIICHTLIICHRLIVTVTRHINRILLRGYVPQFAIFYQLLKDAMSSRFHLCTQYLKLTTGNGFVCPEIICQHLVYLLFRHRQRMYLGLRTLDGLTSQMFLQVIVRPIGHRFELHVFRTDGMRRTHLFLAMQVHLKIADTFQILLWMMIHKGNHFNEKMQTFLSIHSCQSVD